MRYVIHARDGASSIVFKRDTVEAATTKAEEMRSLGWVDVEVIEQPIEKSEAASGMRFDANAGRLVYSAMWCDLGGSLEAKPYCGRLGEAR